MIISCNKRKNLHAKLVQSRQKFLVHQHSRRVIVLYTNMASVTSCENDLLRCNACDFMYSSCLLYISFKVVIIFTIFYFPANQANQQPQMTVGKIYCAKLIYENYKFMRRKGEAQNKVKWTRSC